MTFRENKNARTKELTAYFDKMINTLKPKGDYDFADKMGMQITLSHILLGLYRESAKVTLLKLESTQNDQSPCQLWLFFAKISFKPPFEGYFEHYAVSKPGID